MSREENIVTRPLSMSDLAIDFEQAIQTIYEVAAVKEATDRDLAEIDFAVGLIRQMFGLPDPSEEP